MQLAQPQDPMPAAASYGLVYAALALGLLALVPGVGLVAGPLGLALALAALVRGTTHRGLAGAGLVCALLGTAGNWTIGAAAVHYFEKEIAEQKLSTAKAAETDTDAEEEDAFAAIPTGKPKPRTAPGLSMPAPSLVLRDIDGNQHSLSQYKGQIVILNMWATWCGWCVKEIPDLIEFDKRKDIVVIGISNEEAETQRPFRDEHKIAYPLCISAGPLPSPFDGVQGLPTSFIIDKEGVVREIISGYRPPDQWETLIDAVAKAKTESE